MVYFISGIDTNIGKTYGTAFLAKYLMKEGQKVITQKMVQTGCVDKSEDIEMHRKLLGQPELPEDREGLTCPYIFTFPCSPHLAAEIDNRFIDCRFIDQCTERLLEKGYDTVLMEGAGGLMVPIHRDYLAIDFISDRKYPLVLVTGGRLGSINHTLMSLELCRLRGIEVAFVIYNDFLEEDHKISQDTLKYTDSYLKKYFPKAELLIMPKEKE